GRWGTARRGWPAATGTSRRRPPRASSGGRRWDSTWGHVESRDVEGRKVGRDGPVTGPYDLRLYDFRPDYSTVHVSSALNRSSTLPLPFLASVSFTWPS